MIYTIKIELEVSDLRTLHDVFLSAIGKSFDEDAIVKIFNNLPEDIKLDAIKWGISDTVVRDSIFEWFVDWFVESEF